MPIRLLSPPKNEVFWVGEANMAIPLAVFRRVGGFDNKLQHHEAQDLAFKLHNHGYKVIFDPAFSVEHPYINLSDLSRKTMASKAARRLILKHGYRLK